MQKHQIGKQSTSWLWIVFIAFLVPVTMSTVWANATQPAVGTAHSAEELLEQMMAAEYAIYEEAEKGALELRLQIYKYYMDQKFDVPLATSIHHKQIVDHISDLYRRLLMLRIETIVENKRRWPDQPVTDQIDMLKYQPQLLTDIMLNLDWMVTLDPLELSWDQRKAILTNWHLRDVGRMKKNHQANLRLIDIKSTLSREMPDAVWVKGSVDAIVALHTEIFDDYRLNLTKIWEFLSPDQRAILLKMTLVALRPQ
jgi:hypothetical protein